MNEKTQKRKSDEIYCPECAKPIKKDAVVCPNCGVQIKELKVSTQAEEPIGEEKVVQSLVEGKSSAEIVRELMQQNWTKQKAVKFVRDIEYTLKKESHQYRKLVARRYRVNMIAALIIAAVGTIITAASYNTALTSGGSYVICWGAIVLGIIYFFIGLVGWLRYRG